MNYRFLIYISYAYGIPIGNPLVDEIQSRGYEVKYFAEEKETISYFSDFGNVLLTVKEVIQYNPQIILCTSNSVPDFFPGIKIQIFHGFSVGKREENKGHFNIRGWFDLYCTQGKSTTEKFKSLAAKYGYFDVVETGWSKVDGLFPIKKNNKNEKPIVLVSSTFTPRLSLAHSEEIFKEIIRLSSSGKYEWVVVLHPKMDKDIVEKFKSIKNDFLTFYDTTDLIPLFKKADVMFADTTSAIYEFLLQEKPVVTYRNNRPGNHLCNITEPHELSMALKYVLKNPEELIQNIKKFNSELHPYTDGKSSKRIVDAAIDFLHKDKSYLKAKPLNLIRKIKIRKKLHFFTFKSFLKPPTFSEERFS
ncbi:MAG: CDP-glycerol glycerophosphotransferase [Bacteroidetes bacterium HGW-Bacteroidetes-2]|jgi:CDP-glycerol glycerophosphotransferase (TagB/SpsB family)|nr:MAG: CDP-glycerol glycerophosphotransferase [Bacteroidetes bacterium HGW-Bacteroidetes-2]